MKRIILATALTLSLLAPNAYALPPGFIEQVVAAGFSEPVGLTFGPEDRMFVWEKGGKVWIIQNGVRLPNPLIDLSDEVNTYWTRGLTGLTLDPDYAKNGYVYLMYTVDWEYYITDGNPDRNLLDTNHDTFGRLVRYTSDPDDDFRSFIPESRWVMIGETHDTGFAVTLASHTQNVAVFAPDGTLLVSAGDGASMLGPDVGGSRNSCCSSNTAEQDGIISVKEQIGAFRAQLVDTHSGKILRIDPATAEGVPSNPYFDASAPSAPRSRVWVLGLRNPYSFAVRPGTGGVRPSDGDPGVLMIGDVGWDRWERFVVATEAGQNFGWPLIEGLVAAPSYPGFRIPNLDAPNPLFDGQSCTQEFFFFTDLLVQESLNDPSFPNPCDANVQIPDRYTYMNRRGELAWRNGRVFNTPRSMVPEFDQNGNAIQVAIDDQRSSVDGPHLNGIATVGGVFYTGDKFPYEYYGSFFISEPADAPRWIIRAEFDDNHALTRIREFRGDANIAPTALTVDPDGNGIYYAHHLPNNRGQIRRITYDCNGNGIADDRDIRQGNSEDENGNGIPDECEIVGDVNGDGEVNLEDHVVFFECLTGPGGGVPGGCHRADANDDDDVDLDDFTSLQTAMPSP